MNITYIAHSGFSVETEAHRLIFDYYRGALDVPDDGLTTVFFVSHHHEDHYSREIYKYAARRDTHYVLSREIRDYPEGASVTSVRPGENISVGGVSVTTLRSTDCGVAYLVGVDGQTVYHAGDLHLWVWDGAPGAQNAAVEMSFKSELSKLRGISIDAAFMPLDPRQDEDGVKGFDFAMRTLDIKKAFPMHFWGQPDYVSDFMASDISKPYRDRVVALTEEGGMVEI